MMSTKLINVKNHFEGEPNAINGKGYSMEDEIVITGLSARLPESSNIEEFKQKLFDGLDLVTDDERRWSSGLHGLPTRNGKLKDLESFDATFFGVIPKQAEVMDPQLRILLELTHEAIVDAGVNPNEIRGSKTGVFIGVMYCESDVFWTADPEVISGYELTGCSRSMFANRISYAFDLNGPSLAVDTACSSSSYALNQAMVAMRTGQCEAAIVGGINLVLNPATSLEYHRLNMLSIDGKCKAFDSSRSGYVRSEAAVVLYLQKYSDAKRVYATIVNSKTNSDGGKVQGITSPSGKMQNKLMREVYEEAEINPNDVAYVEAHGTGTAVGDPQELNSIADLFCKNRTAPLLIGSIKSNMGHSEAASGLCGVAKVLIGMETGVMPGNLHYKNPNPDIPALTDGRLKVVDRATSWEGGLVGINSFGFGGANAHIILRSNVKSKHPPVVDADAKLEKIVVVSGRTKEAVDYFLDRVKENQNDDEFVALIQDLHKMNIPGHGYRGFQILGGENIRKVEEHVNGNRPIWYIFSGMGSQWPGMGRELLKIDRFANSLRHCADVLKPEGVDLMDFIENGTVETFDDVLSSFVSIAAIQVALVDVLTSIGIKPDGMVGHSIGELGCAYADGTLTSDQTVMAAYWRGKSILESELPVGAMAVVGLSWSEAKSRCPVGIELACDNSADSVTISGPLKNVADFVGQLQEENIFARTVNSSGCAFHSTYISPAGKKFYPYLEKIIPNPKQRSSRWISSSVPEKDWDLPVAKFSSADYHVNNLMSPVLFREAIAHVPENAIIIEIAPHGLLESILSRSMTSMNTIVSLQKRNSSNNLTYLLTNLGKLYLAGVQPNFAKLYPTVDYPVSRGTPMISSLIKWDHSIEWSVPDFSGRGSRSGENLMKFDLSKDNDAFLAGHIIDGRVLFPASGYLILAWKTLAKIRGTDFDKLPVTFDNVQIRRATIMPEKGSVKFSVSILDGTGDFEINEDASIVVSGKIRVAEKTEQQQPTTPVPVSKTFQLNKNDVYKYLGLRGYEYKGVFRGIKSSDNHGIFGEIYWQENWISFIDAMLQFSIFGKNKRGLYLPTGLNRAVINPILHKKLAEKLGAENGLLVYSQKNIDVIKSGGIELHGTKTTLAPRNHQNQATPQHERYTFVPYESSHFVLEDPTKSEQHALTSLLQIVIENIDGIKVEVVEVAGDRTAEALLVPLIHDILSSEPLLNFDLQVASTSPEDFTAALERWDTKCVYQDVSTSPAGQDLHLVISADVLSKKDSAVLINCAAALRPGGFIVLKETGDGDPTILKSTGLVLVAKQITPGRVYLLLKKMVKNVQPIVVEIMKNDFSWIQSVKAALSISDKEDRKFLLVCRGEILLGMIGLMNCIRREAERSMNTSYVFIIDEKADEFSTNSPFYENQLSKDLFANVLKGGEWGSYRHLKIDQQQNDTQLIMVENAYINTMVKGDLTSLGWIQGPLSYHQPDQCPEDELCYVYYAPLNIRDMMLATGKLTDDYLPRQDSVLGLEFAGRNSKGRRVMGIVNGCGLATTVLADKEFTWEVPEKWSLEEAATVPIAYATGYYALMVNGRIRRGDRVLIDAGSSGVGLASIAIALHAGCEVFTTVETDEKREFIRKRFPELTGENIGNSRDTSVEEFILSATNGRGVDVVLNSLADEKLQACGIKCLAKHGRFLDVGKYDSSGLRTALFSGDSSFHGILLDSLFGSDSFEKREVVRLITEGILNGIVQPLPFVVFPEQEIGEGFRYMTTSEHIGKIIIKIRDEDDEKVVKTVSAVPRTYMNPYKSYVIVGGLGGFGLELTDWMITRRAKHFVLSSRSGIKSGYQALCVRRWMEAGINIVVSTTDAVSVSGAESIIEEARRLAPVGGIFNLAAVLRDALIENSSEDDFETVTIPKINATKSLDYASRKLCPTLDHFVVFSSVSCGRGNVGQANYGFANSAMERIVEERQASGLPGLAIQWGAIGDVGLILETVGENDTEVGGTQPQRISSCMSTMDVFLRQPHPVLASMVVGEKSKTKESTDPAGLLEAIGNILGIKDIKTVDSDKTLADFGMDSLLSMEIREILKRWCDQVFTAREISRLNFRKLMEFSRRSRK